MRLGTKFIAVGIVVFLFGIAQPAVHESSSYVCSSGFYETCETITTTEPNQGRTALVFLGGFFISGGFGGFGGWIGTVDAKGRVR